MQPPGGARIILKLYVTGSSPRSELARTNLEHICGVLPPRAVEVEVIDVVARPQLAEDERLLATPVVVRETPPPSRRVIGDLSDHASVLAGLDLAGGLS
ncbi:MAG: KaiB domain protein [Thermoleophilia bacterium]|nr:KaiB domain protein [Thermoleophilia bacterium]